VTLALIVVAAGSGERLGSRYPKAFVEVGGQSLLEHALGPIASLPKPLELVVVAPQSWVEPAREISERALNSAVDIRVVPGGATRSESVRSGLEAIGPNVKTVLIHDAARAFAPQEVFQRVIDAVEAGAAGVIPVREVADTIVPVDDQSRTKRAVPRDELCSVQTPQGFSAAELRASYESFDGDATDDAEVLRLAGYEVIAVEGHEASHKITYPSDLEAVRRGLADNPDLRVGTAVDVHQFDPEARLIVGGMHFDGPGLSGHSDGDVVIHAVTDALLGAAGLGDLGTHFGTSRPEYAGARSEMFVKEALGLLAGAGFSPRSVSVQYVGNTPRLGEQREKMSRQLSALVGCAVHVSATTTDGLGLTGRGEGAAAIATALVEYQPGAEEASG